VNRIEIQDIKFKYPNSTKLVLDVKEFALAEGERVFLYGPSGCGKTTLLETLAGVLVPQQGILKICNTDTSSLNSSQRDRFRAAHIGYIFQSFNLIPYLNVLENITLPLYLSTERRKNISKDREKEETLFLCTELGIDTLINQSVNELSVGQQQRVAAARALLGQPELILADEPTSSLDYDHREKFIQLLFSLCKKSNISMLFVSHDRSLQGLFDRSLSLVEINKAGRS
jgi:putative ABC transport system ATP-binding protein